VDNVGAVGVYSPARQASRLVRCSWDSTTRGGSNRGLDRQPDGVIRRFNRNLDALLMDNDMPARSLAIGPIIEAMTLQLSGSGIPRARTRTLGAVGEGPRHPALETVVRPAGRRDRTGHQFNDGSAALRSQDGFQRETYGRKQGKDAQQPVQLVPVPDRLLIFQPVFLESVQVHDVSWCWFERPAFFTSMESIGASA
jgi:hypothetical protein